VQQELKVKTSAHGEFHEITEEVQDVVNGSKISSGICYVYVPHTTAGVTINENADPDVKSDMLQALEKAVPWKQPFYQHGEGNSAAHVKASMMGFTATVFVEHGKLQLGTWQGIYLCEFDGPRSRKVWVRVEGM